MDVDLPGCIEGNPAAWDEFVVRYGGVIHAAVRRVLSSRGVGDREAAEDAAQDVFVRLLKHDARLLRNYDPSRAALTTWLTLIARSTAIDALRRRRPEIVDADVVADRPAPTPAPPPSGPVLPLQLLTERQRLVLTMLFDDGLTVRAIADALGVNEQTVRSTKHKAMLRLREHLDMPGAARASKSDDAGG